MKLKFITAQDFDKNVKCSIHKNGKLGFSTGAIGKLQLNTKKSISFAINEEDETDGNLYAVVEESVIESAFKVNRAGNYFYLSTKAFFDSLGVDYKESRIIYDIVDFEYEGAKMYKFLKREITKSKKKKLNEEEE